MNLVIDIGNTRTKFGLFNKKELLKQHVVLNNEVDAQLNFIDSIDFNDCLIASTTEIPNQLLYIISKKSKFEQVDEHTKLPITIVYNSRKTLGDDRIAAVCGARSLQPKGNLLAITFGTCITFNFLNDKNEFIGGSISPGLIMRYQAMNHFTGKLPLVKNNLFDELIGTSTEESLQSGVRKGIVAEVDGIIDEYRLLFPELQVFISGGDTTFFESRLKNRIFANPNLVLQGLNEILIYNQTN